MPDDGEKLRVLYELRWSLPFPSSHPDETIQAVHDHLIVYDAEVAGHVSRILKGELAAKDSLSENPALRDEIRRLLREKHEAADLLGRYLEEYDRLSRMIALARALK